MNRDARMRCAEQTLEICKAGFYTTPSGRRIEISKALDDAVANTVLYSPEKPPRMPSGSATQATEVEVVNETTFGALQQLARDRSGHMGCLNFASARNPGGGFLSGAQAQEESLARASGLYPCLTAQPQYYERNRAHRSALYLDLLIFSPNVPFFRNDSGALLDQPVLASVITAPAPNAGAVAANEPANRDRVGPTLRHRAELVLAAAVAHGIQQLVLGAWGCGVFRNEPRFVARVFADLLRDERRFKGRFEHVTFAVFDRGEPCLTYQAFADELTDLTPSKN
jgi:uncharacterized protein (TIGR02452 family)